MTTTREVFYGVISQEVTPHFFMMELTEEIKICTVFGEPDVAPSPELRALAEASIEHAVLLGYHIFYFGGTGSFCDLCHSIVEAMNKKYPQASILVFSYISSATSSCIYEHLRQMIDDSSMVISCVKRSRKSDLRQAYRYAKKKKIPLLNLYRKKLKITK